MLDSLDVARAALKLSATKNREEEETCIKSLDNENIKAVAGDIGGNVINSAHIIIERSIFMARKAGIIKEEYNQDGIVAGAAREALSQITTRAIGLNGGGKIAICRSENHLSICIFMSVGMMYLNEAMVGLGHRIIVDD